MAVLYICEYNPFLFLLHSMSEPLGSSRTIQLRVFDGDQYSDYQNIELVMWHHNTIRILKSYIATTIIESSSHLN